MNLFRKKWVENTERAHQRLTVKILWKLVCDPRVQEVEEESEAQDYSLSVRDMHGILENPFQKRVIWSKSKRFNSHLDITVPRSGC